MAHNLRHLTYALKRDVLTALDVRVTLYPSGHDPRYTIEAAVPLPDAAGSEAIVTSSTR